MTVVAVRETPTIICPPWCEIPEAEHVSQLPGLEGVAVHWSGSQLINHAEGGEQTEVRITRLTYVDGVRNTTEGPADLIYLDDTHLTEAQALQLAKVLTDAVATARA